MIFRHDRGQDFLPKEAFGGATVVTMANVPGGSWLLFGKSDAVNHQNTAGANFRCLLWVGDTPMAQASGHVHSSVLVMPLSMMAAVDSPAPFTVTLRCHHDQALPNAPNMEESQLVAIRTGAVDVAPG